MVNKQVSPKLINQKNQITVGENFFTKKMKCAKGRSGSKKLFKNTILQVLVTHKNSELSRKILQFCVGMLTSK